MQVLELHIGQSGTKAPLRGEMNFLPQLEAIPFFQQLWPKNLGVFAFSPGFLLDHGSLLYELSPFTSRAANLGSVSMTLCHLQPHLAVGKWDHLPSCGDGNTIHLESQALGVVLTLTCTLNASYSIQKILLALPPKYTQSSPTPHGHPCNRRSPKRPCECNDVLADLPAPAASSPTVRRRLG